MSKFKTKYVFFTDKNHFGIHTKLKELSKIYNNCSQNIDNCANNEDFDIKKIWKNDMS